MTAPEPDHDHDHDHDQVEGSPHDRLCNAASALYYAVVRNHASKTGMPVALPSLICPVGTPPCVCAFSDDELDAAEQFLVRLGVIRTQANPLA